MSRCEHCPAAGRCVSRATGHIAFCDWAKAGGRWRLRVAELSEGLDDATPDPPRPAVDESVRLLRSMRACAFRRPEPG